MIIKTYGIYDAAGKEFISTFTSKNDETAERSAKYIVRDKGFDRIAGRDYVIQHVFDFDNETGIVVDNNIRMICPLGPEIDNLKIEEDLHYQRMMAMQKPLAEGSIKEKKEA